METHKSFEKRVPHYTKEEWHETNKRYESEAKSLSDEAIKSGRESSQLRSVVTNVTTRKHEHSDFLLDKRIHDIGHWLENLREALRAVERQLLKLRETKESVEEATAKDKILLETAKDVAMLRDQREGIDLAEDEPYHKLNEEKAVLDSAIQRLQYDADQTFGLMNDLLERKDRLQADIRDKETALNTEKHMRNLTEFALDEITVKPWPKELPEIHVNETEWTNNCISNIRAAVEAVDQSYQKVTESNNLIRDSNNDIKNCREATEYALHRRCQEALEARDSLAKQRQMLIDRASRLREENYGLERSLSDNLNNKKLVHTRLEDRKLRPKKELCYYGLRNHLLEEDELIEDSKYNLNKRLEDNKILKNQIEKQILDTETELQRKEKTLAIEMAARNLHNRPPKSQYQTEIYWLSPTSDNDFVRGNVKRHLNAREFDKMNQIMRHPGYVDHKILELATTFPSAGGTIYHPTDVSRIVCEHW